MSGELRLDPLTGNWVSIVGNRQARPNLPATGCPFCVGGLEAPEPYDTKAFVNRWPAYAPGEPVDLAAAAATGRAAAVGAAEVILYSPVHDGSLGSLGVAQVRKVVDLWAERTAALLARPEVEYVLVFESRGAEVGATIHHPHGQLYAFPFVPPLPATEAGRSRDIGCVVCSSITTELDVAERVVVDDGEWAAWVPFASGYPYGVDLAPRRHVGSLADLDDAGRDSLAGSSPMCWAVTTDSGRTTRAQPHLPVPDVDPSGPRITTASTTCTCTWRHRSGLPAWLATSLGRSRRRHVVESHRSRGPAATLRRA